MRDNEQAMPDIAVISNSQQPLHELLCRELNEADEFRAASAFLNSGGLSYIMPGMRRILEGEGSVYIIHGADFRITDPQAVRSLVELSAKYADMSYFVHFDWALATRHMFHPKLYLTTSDYQRYCAIIGSSNLTHGGMSGNVEVNAVIRGELSDAPVSQCLNIFDSILASDALMEPDMTFVERYERLHDEVRESPVTETPPPDLSERYQELIDLYEEQLESRRYWRPDNQNEFLIQAIENLSGEAGMEYVGLDAIYRETERLVRSAGHTYKWDTFNNSLRGRLNTETVGRGGQDLFERRGGVPGRYGQYRLSDKGKAYSKEKQQSE